MTTAFAPASISNLNCGFDLLGMAIERPGDEVSVAWNKEGKLRILSIKNDGGRLPYDAKKNTASVAIQALLDKVGEKRGMDIYIHKKMPFGSGLGSSAASSVAGVVAANALLDQPLSKRELLPFAIAGEQIASGSIHADNVAPSLLGGLILIRSYQPLDIIDLPVPENLLCSVIYPHIEILTQQARAILPKEVSMKSAIRQNGNLAGFISGLYQNDLSLVIRSMVHDFFAEPYRKKLLPHFEEIKGLAMDEGALAFGISGSGPSMFVFCDHKDIQFNISSAIQQLLSNRNILSNVYHSPVNVKGAVVLE